MTPTLHIACIVEGKGEESSVRLLLQRIVHHLNPGIPVEVPRPIRIPRHKMVADEAALSRALALAAISLHTPQPSDRSLILILLDADDDPACKLGPSLAATARRLRSDHDILVCAAVREFENWFIAAAESLRAQRNLPEDLQRPADPEIIQGAKEWIGKHLLTRKAYKPAVDQPAFTRIFDLGEARHHSPSFSRLLHQLEFRLSRFESNK